MTRKLILYILIPLGWITKERMSTDCKALLIYRSRWSYVLEAIWSFFTIPALCKEGGLKILANAKKHLSKVGLRLHAPKFFTKHLLKVGQVAASL